MIAAEPGNYFTPGVTERLAPFFTARGYLQTARTQNLVVEKLPEEFPSGVRAGDRDRVLDFIEREFGSIWRFEASRGTTIFSIEQDGAIAGFSTHEANNRGLGFFGPTGVAEAFRDRGLGRQLLLASLADLRRHGYTRAVIPWTEAIDFYRKSCGARVEQQFVILRRIAP